MRSWPVSARAAFALAMLLALAAGCTCGDEDWGDDIDRDCDCQGLSQAVFDDCHGVATVDDADVSREEYATSCADAVNGRAADADRFQCQIDALCDAEDCEDLADRMRLCAY